MKTIWPPTQDSIFGVTQQGVPNPNISHRHPWPTRYHGPIWTVPDAGQNQYESRPYARPPFMGLGAPPRFKAFTRRKMPQAPSAVQEYRAYFQSTTDQGTQQNLLYSGKNENAARQAANAAIGPATAPASGVATVWVEFVTGSLTKTPSAIDKTIICSSTSQGGGPWGQTMSNVPACHLAAVTPPKPAPRKMMRFRGLGAAPMFEHVTGSGVVDGVLGTALGYVAAPKKEDRPMWAIFGGLAAYAAGMAGLVGVGAALLYARSKDKG